MPLRLICVLFSDGLDTTSEPRPPLDESVRVLVVSGVRHADAFADVRYIAFESLRAAFGHIE